VSLFEDHDHGIDSAQLFSENLGRKDVENEHFDTSKSEGHKMNMAAIPFARKAIDA
jgi:hypothetical protein